MSCPVCGCGRISDDVVRWEWRDTKSLGDRFASFSPPLVGGRWLWATGPLGDFVGELIERYCPLPGLEIEAAINCVTEDVTPLFSIPSQGAILLFDFAFFSIC